MLIINLKLIDWVKITSKLKALLNLEIGAILAFVFVKFKIKPNQITFYIFFNFNWSLFILYRTR